MFPRVLEFPARSAKRFRRVLLELLAVVFGVDDERN
jgi:hypothetical protein